MSIAGAEQAISVYCFASRELAAEASRWRDSVPATTGVFTPAPIDICVDQDVAAVYRRVDVADYTGERGGRHLSDLEWLVPRAEHHQQVVAAAARAAAVLPVRFATLFQDLEELASWLEKRRSTVLDALDMLRGRDEWALRLLAEPGAANAAEADAGATKGLDGRAYLMARKAARDERGRRREERLGHAAAEVERLAASFCVRLTKLDVRGFDKPLRRAGGDRRETVASWAALVERGRSEDLRRQIRRLGDGRIGHGLAVETTGPWPAYNFCPDLTGGERPGHDGSDP